MKRTHHRRHTTHHAQQAGDGPHVRIHIHTTGPAMGVEESIQALTLMAQKRNEVDP
jgi:hypothetical protein